jgi:hypothetical protein
MGFGGVGSFTQLTDAPRSYAGQALKVLGVKAGENGLEFALGLPPLDLGAGFNFLRVSQLGGNLFVQWVDVQGLIIALTGAVNRLITPPELLLPAPSASQVTVVESSPPGLTATPALSAVAPSAGALAAMDASGGGVVAAPGLSSPLPAASATAALV